MPTLESDLAAVLDLDRVEAINLDGAAVIDSEVVAVINLDMMVVIYSDRGAADKLEGVTRAVSAGLVVTNLVMARQDVVAVVSEVAVEINLDGPVQAVIGSDLMVAMDSDGMAATQLW